MIEDGTSFVAESSIEGIGGFELGFLFVWSIMFAIGGLAAMFGRSADSGKRQFHLLGIVFLAIGIGGFIYALENALDLGSGLGVEVMLGGFALMTMFFGVIGIAMIPIAENIGDEESGDDVSPASQSNTRVIGRALMAVSALVWLAAFTSLVYWVYTAITFHDTNPESVKTAQKFLWDMIVMGLGTTILIWSYVHWWAQKQAQAVLLFAVGFGLLGWASDATFGTTISVALAPIYWVLELLDLATVAAEHGWGLIVWVVFTWMIVLQVFGLRAWATTLLTGIVLLLYVGYGPTPLDAYYKPILDLYQHFR